MKIYLAASISGGREFVEHIKLICETLKEMGHEVLTENLVVNLSPEDQSPNRNTTAIVSRDVNLIKECDAFVAEVSKGSHGVGYEHKTAEDNNKAILFLRHSSLSREARYSAFFDGTGYRRLRFSYYDENNLEDILEAFFVDLFGENNEGKIIRER